MLTSRSLNTQIKHTHTHARGGYTLLGAQAAIHTQQTWTYTVSEWKCCMNTQAWMHMTQATTSTAAYSMN